MDSWKPSTQVVRGAEQLSDAKLKALTRVYIPSAIERLAELCNSKNEAIALGAIKVMIAKNIPDLKAVELKGEDGKPLLLFDVKEYLEHIRSGAPATKAE